jgi:DNA-binding beta-propeller fold protein YncE
MTIFNASPPEAPEVSASPDEGNGADAVLPSKMSNKRKRRIAALLIALVILGLLFAWYLLNRKPLTELPGLSDTTMPHYEMSIYGAAKPLGVAVTPSGDRIYVTESDGTRMVRVYDRAGKQLGTLKPPASTGPTHLPMYVAINPTTQDVYVSDRQTSSIYIYNAKGTFLRTFAPKGNLGAKWAPLALAFSPDGSLYVTDINGPTTKTHRVVVFGPDGTLVHSMGTPGLSFPNGIVVDSHGNIEVSDSNNGRLVVFNVAGKTLAIIASGVGEGDLGMPRGAAVDDSGRLYVVDTSDQNVKVYNVGSSESPTPAYVGLFGTEGQLDGTFEFPNGIATDTRAHIYVTDRENNRVQVWGY